MVRQIDQMSNILRAISAGQLLDATVNNLALDAQMHSNFFRLKPVGQKLKHVNVSLLDSVRKCLLLLHQL